MKFEEFNGSLDRSQPPDGLTVPLRGLWHCAKGDWDKSHILVQDDPGRDAAWVHAHLHRIEGDLDNARYWYNRAGRPMANDPIEAEREAMARALLD